MARQLELVQVVDLDCHQTIAKRAMTNTSPPNCKDTLGWHDMHLRIYLPTNIQLVYDTLGDDLTCDDHHHATLFQNYILTYSSSTLPPPKIHHKTLTSNWVMIWMFHFLTLKDRWWRFVRCDICQEVTLPSHLLCQQKEKNLFFPL